MKRDDKSFMIHCFKNNVMKLGLTMAVSSMERAGAESIQGKKRRGSGSDSDGRTDGRVR
jgi:hypothetical protein